MTKLMSRVFRIEFVMDCILVSLVTVSSLVIYNKMIGLSIKTELVEENYHVKKILAGDKNQYEFLLITHKTDPNRKFTLKTKEPDTICSSCGTSVGNQ